MELYDKKYVYFEWDNKLDGKIGFVAQNIAALRGQVNNNPKAMVTLSGSDDDTCPFTYYVDDEITCDYQFAYYDPYYELRKAYLEGKQLQFKNDNGDWIDVAGEPLFKVDEYRIKPETWYIILDDDGVSRTSELCENETVLFEGIEEECIEWMDKYKKFEKIMVAWKQGKTIQYKDGNEWIDWVLHEVPLAGALDTWKEWRIKDECEEAVESTPFDSIQELIAAWDEKYPQNKNRPEGTMPLIWIKDKYYNRSYLITEYYFERDMNECDVGTSNNYFTLKELFEEYTFADGTVIGKVKE